MVEPSAQDFVAYERVKRYLSSRKAESLSNSVTGADSLFAGGAGTATIGSVSNLDFPWDRYRDGYYEAATLLSTLYGEETMSPWVAYPILFLYRHYLELILKSLILEANASFKGLSGAQASDLQKHITREHNLTTLWETFVKIVVDNRRSPMIDDTAPIRRVLAQFTELDPVSMNTRYGLKKDLTTPSIQTVFDISLHNLRDLLAKMTHDFHQIFIRMQYVDEPWWDEDAKLDYE